MASNRDGVYVLEPKAAPTKSQARTLSHGARRNVRNPDPHAGLQGLDAYTSASLVIVNREDGVMFSYATTG